MREIKALLGDLPFEIMLLDNFRGIPEVSEDGVTFLDNALKKARFVSEWTGELSLADDSGLEVEALQGRPGVYSSRYSGQDATDETNNNKLIQELRGIPFEKRKAVFRCVMVLYHPTGHYDFFEGVLEGFIGFENEGTNGFGYDPLFFVPELRKTVAQLQLEEKNRISHRAKALKELKKYLQGDKNKEND